MLRRFARVQFLLLSCCLLLAAACTTDEGTADEATEVVTDRVVTEEETVIEEVTVIATPPDDDGNGDTNDGTDGGEQPFPANTERDEAPASGEQLTLTDIRVGTHDGYDRVTFEFSGDGEPGWVVEYTDQARAQGSGQVIDVEGDAILEAMMSSVAYPTGEDAYTSQPNNVPPSGWVATSAAAPTRPGSP